MATNEEVMAAKHGRNWNGEDRTLCGIAIDEFEGYLDNQECMMAKRGETITCADCTAIIKHVRRLVRRDKRRDGFFVAS